MNLEYSSIGAVPSKGRRLGVMKATLDERSDDRAPHSIEVMVVENDPGQAVLRDVFEGGSIAAFRMESDDGEVIHFTARIRELRTIFP